MHLLSWTLSCLSLRKHHEEVVYTPIRKVAKLLAKRCTCLYTEVVVDSPKVDIIQDNHPYMAWYHECEKKVLFIDDLDLNKIFPTLN